ncbi:hypothetical protein KSP40_PGU017696 [Platanthera guangdongensis]|uniref:Uncharacterized protein n=1 Tax=Platanthera guangdongensis TaxID=2320717 RepID=A0ABR2MBA2_9ASPA
MVLHTLTSGLFFGHTAKSLLYLPPSCLNTPTRRHVGPSSLPCSRCRVSATSPEASSPSLFP